MTRYRRGCARSCDRTLSSQWADGLYWAAPQKAALFSRGAHLFKTRTGGEPFDPPPAIQARLSLAAAQIKPATGAKRTAGRRNRARGSSVSCACRQGERNCGEFCNTNHDNSPNDRMKSETFNSASFTFAAGADRAPCYGKRNYKAASPQAASTVPLAPVPPAQAQAQMAGRTGNSGNPCSGQCRNRHCSARTLPDQRPLSP